jgi:hypothetical protein
MACFRREWPVLKKRCGLFWLEPSSIFGVSSHLVEVADQQPREAGLSFNFFLDDNHKLSWGTTESMPTLTEQQAMIVAVANMASALENIALQVHQALGPLQEIADKHDRA